MTKPRPDRGRHQARKRAVDLLFEAEARGITPAEAAESRELLAQSQSDVSALNRYTVTVAQGVTQHAAHIDDLISTHLQGWTLDRLPAVDRAILRVAVWELLHADDVPEPVAVDEAVELAKHLSTDDSPGFVNGVLGQVMLVTPQIRAAAAAIQGGSEGSGEIAGARGGADRRPQIGDVARAQLVTRSHEKSATDTDYFCESFRFDKSVDNGGLAQMERLLQFGSVSRDVGQTVE